MGYVIFSLASNMLYARRQTVFILFFFASLSLTVRHCNPINFIFFLNATQQYEVLIFYFVQG
jgi:hypothetical protein